MIYFSTRFEKNRARLPLSVRRKLSERPQLFMAEPFHPLLNNHPLSGEYKGFRSINISSDYRAIFYVEGDAYLFSRVGTHSELYG